MTRIVLKDGDPADDLRRILDWLDLNNPPGPAPACVPDMDVYETATTLEVIADLPGVSADSIRIGYTQGGIVIAGQKIPGGCGHCDAAFHLAERGFGRFARVFALSGAYDVGRARATLTRGELHVVLPRLEERRGDQIRIPVDVP